MDASIEYFLGSRFWGGVKNAILHHAESMTRSTGAGLEEQIRGIADKVAQDKSIELRFVLGITAVGVMIFQQIGIAAFAEAAVRSYEIKNHHSPEQLIKLRQGRPAGWRALFGAKRHKITFDESQQEGSFQALEGQDLSMASNCDKRDFRSQDHRRIAGPVPANAAAVPVAIAGLESSVATRTCRRDRFREEAIASFRLCAAGSGSWISFAHSLGVPIQVLW